MMRYDLHKLTVRAGQAFALCQCIGLAIISNKAKTCRRTLNAAVTAALTLSCSNQVVQPGDELKGGTWGGKDAGVMVGDATAHVHIGCTFGNFPSLVSVDVNGRFSVAGSYVLRAYPIQIGPELPAQFAGQIIGDRLTLLVSVNDTVENQIVVKGPVTVTFGREPELGPCPICRKP